MARDHARLRLDIWADDDWRDLPSNAQWLYMLLSSHPSLGFAGVADWRPARLAGHARETTAEDVEYAAAWLEAGEYLVIDRNTEEVLIRSWIKHDGLLTSPNITKAMVKAHAAIGSAVLRAVVVDQLERLKQARPEMAGWKHCEGVLRKRSLTVEEAFQKLPSNPSAKGSDSPSAFRAALRSPFSVLPSPHSDLSSDPNSQLTSEA